MARKAKRLRIGEVQESDPGAEALLAVDRLVPRERRYLRRMGVDPLLVYPLERVDTGGYGPMLLSLQEWVKHIRRVEKRFREGRGDLGDVSADAARGRLEALIEEVEEAMAESRRIAGAPEVAAWAASVEAYGERVVEKLQGEWEGLREPSGDREKAQKRRPSRFRRGKR